MERPKIGQLLRKKRIVSSAQLQFLLDEQQTKGVARRLGEIAIAHGFMDHRTLTVLLGTQLRVPIVLHLERIRIDRRALDIVPRALCERFKVVPLSVYDGEKLVLATGDPTNEILFRAIEQHTHLDVAVAVAPESDVMAAIERLYDSTAHDKTAPPVALPKPDDATSMGPSPMGRAPVPMDAPVDGGSSSLNFLAG